jgi:hypothetical protein
VAAYTPQDVLEPRGLVGSLASCYVLHRVLWGASQRFEFDSRWMTFRFRSSQHTQAPAGVREEAYPDLWDAQPRAYLRVLCAARLPEAHPFGLRAIRGPHRAVLEAAAAEEVLDLLQAPYEPTVELGLAELERRFDPARPDWAVLDRLLADGRPRPRDLGQRWLRQTAPVWTRDPERFLAWLESPQAATRTLAAEIAGAGLGHAPALRRALAPRVLAALRAPEAAEGAHDGYARLAREALADELGALLGVSDLIAWLTGTPNSLSAQSVAGELLGRRPEAVRELGLERLTALAEHEVAAVRAAAQALLRSAQALLAADPAPLLVLAESDWSDTRRVAIDLLRDTARPAQLGLDGLVGLLDSNLVDVQGLGRELVLRHFAELPAAELVARLVQHPHPNMRRFALDLVVEHLPPGAAALAGLESFFRTALFDLWPQRRVKQRVVAFLLSRGLQDERQAEVAAGILRDVVRVQGRADFENALEALVRLQLAYPRLEGPVSLRAGGLA